jgi:hypothetical protein
MKLLFSVKQPSHAAGLRFAILNYQFEIVAPSRWPHVGPSKERTRQKAYLLTEALVYIGLVFVLLGVAYAGLYRFMDNSVLLRRYSEDISRAMHAGERWRADIRLAVAGFRLETNPDGAILHLKTAHGEIAYTTRQGAVLRRIDAGPWATVLNNVRSSSMLSDVKYNVTAWRWELELQPQIKGAIKPGRVRPLFTFLATPRVAPSS